MRGNHNQSLTNYCYNGGGLTIHMNLLSLEVPVNVGRKIKHSIREERDNGKLSRESIGMGG